MQAGSAYAVTVERAFIGTGLAMALCFSVGLWPLAGLIPPPPPGASASEVAAIFSNNTSGIIGGSLLIMIAAGLYLPFCLAVSSAMERHAPDCALLSRAQLACAAVNVVFFSLIGLLWTAAAYRSDALPSEVRLLNDLAWFIMVVPTLPFIIQAISVAIVALAGDAQRSVLPRWLGYFSLWCALLVVPGMLSGFFKTGLLAWNGLLSFWLEVVAFLLWLVVMVVVLNRALPRPVQGR